MAVCAFDLFGVDSNSAMRESFVGGRWDTTLARGKISDAELRQLDLDLTASRKEQDGLRIRVVMVHHSFSAPSRLLDAQQLHPQSVEMLLYLAKTSDFCLSHGSCAFEQYHATRSREATVFRISYCDNRPRTRARPGGKRLFHPPGGARAERGAVEVVAIRLEAGDGAFINGMEPLAELEIR